MTYTRDFVKSLNTYDLRKIPAGSKYDVLRDNGVSGEYKTPSTAVKHPVIPTYLKQKYGENQHTYQRGLVKGTQSDYKAPGRRRLCDPVEDSSDPRLAKINADLRDILSKLSLTNRDKLLGEFANIQIPEECAEKFIQDLYMFTVDLGFMTGMMDLYIEVFRILSEKQNKIYEQVAEKVLAAALEPMEFGSSEEDVKKGNVGVSLILNSLPICI